MRARQFVFHFSSQGSWAPMSVKSNGGLSSFACPTRKSRWVLSSTANATKTRLLIFAPFQLFFCLPTFRTDTGSDYVRRLIIKERTRYVFDNGPKRFLTEEYRIAPE